jgi:kynurenine/2-aminoadipate aminotransferase
MDVDGRVVRVDTFAKLLGPGYRLGWASGPPAVIQKLSLHFAAVSVGSCSLSQVSRSMTQPHQRGLLGKVQPLLV